MKEEHTEKYKKLGLKISYYRKLRGLTQENLAEKIGKTTSYLGQIEAPNIIRAVSLDTLFDIAQALEVQPKKFLDYDDD
ncbi:MAG: helix-turn-helix transcriptional regulator [Eubacteriales bacterium]